MVKHITVSIADSEITLNLMVLPALSDTGHLVKSQVEREIGVELARLQDLSWGDQILRNWEFMALVMPSASDLRLTVTPLTPETDIIVGVSYPSLEYEEEFFVKETDTVMDLKMQIMESEEFNGKRTDGGGELDPKDLLLKRFLLKSNSPVYMYDDDFALSRYCIYWGCDIELELLIVREVD